MRDQILLAELRSGAYDRRGATHEHTKAQFSSVGEEGQDGKRVVPTEPPSSCTLDTGPLLAAWPSFDSERGINDVRRFLGVGSGEEAAAIRQDLMVGLNSSTLDLLSPLPGPLSLR